MGQYNVPGIVLDHLVLRTYLYCSILKTFSLFCCCRQKYAYRASLLLSELRAEQCSGDRGVWPDMKIGDAVEVTVSPNGFVAPPVQYHRSVVVLQGWDACQPLPSTHLVGLHLYVVSCSSRLCLIG